MATSDKADKAVKAKSTGKTGGTDMKQPAAGPVVPSAPVRAGDAVTVSRIPPSQPIESTLVGKADGGRPAAAPNPEGCLMTVYRDAAHCISRVMSIELHDGTTATNFYFKRTSPGAGEFNTADGLIELPAEPALDENGRPRPATYPKHILGKPEEPETTTEDIEEMP